MIGVAVSLIAALAVFVLLGFGLQAVGRRLARLAGAGDRWNRPPRPPVEALVVAIAWSAIGLSVFGALLIGARAFDFTALGVFTAVLALAGLPAFLSALKGLRRSWLTAAALLLLAIPLTWTALRANLTPTHSYQWYYWDLGRQLSIAGGVPQSVLEFGLPVRWHPDYVLAVIGTGAYHALTFPISEVSAIGAYRVPIFLLAVGATYVVFRLWVARIPALIGTAAASATTLYVTKFASYKPESIAFAMGLFATWLLITAVRGRSRGMTLLAGALFGVTVGMHGIAAAVTGMFAICAAAAEIWALAPRHRRAMLGNGLRAGGLALLVVVATGLSLQGRAVVASDAGHPVLEHGQDPTWAFLNRHDGTFYFPPQPTVSLQAEETLEHPWPGGLVASWGWAVGVAAVLGAVLTALRRQGRRRRAAVALLGTVGLIAAAMLFFGIKFDTFIPQHTGLTRIAIYLGLLYGLGLALAADLVAAWLRARRPLDRARLNALGAAAVVFFAAWAVGVGIIALNKYGGIGREGRDALAVLKRKADGPDQAVLSNISTRGLIEFTTGLEAPIEGRQPVIEDPEFLSGANAALVEVHRYFQHPSDPRLLRRLGIRWLLISNGSRGIGSPFDLGLPVDQAGRLASEPYLTRAWSSHNLVLFRVNGPVRRIEPVGPAKPLAGRVALALLAIALAVGALSRSFRPFRAGAWRRGRPAVPAAGCPPAATHRRS
jgi:hypothetical protein